MGAARSTSVWTGMMSANAMTITTAMPMPT